MKTLAGIAFIASTIAAPAAMAQSTMPSSPPPVATSASAQWYSTAGGEIRSSKLIGTSVKNAANETIGDINEVLLDKSGRVVAVIVGVGGFLGMGEREVAVNFASMRLAVDSSNTTIATLDTTKDALKNAPQWKWATPSGGSGTTGASTTK